MDLFRFLTPGIFWLLSIIWTFILIFLIVKLIKKGNKNRLILMLVIVLIIEAFRTSVESIFFGVWSTSLSGFISAKYHLFLTCPEILILPKILNLIAALSIVLILIRKWFSSEEHEREKQENLIKEIHQKLQNRDKMLDEIAKNFPHSFLYIVHKDLTIGYISGQEVKRKKLKYDDYLGKSVETVFKRNTGIIREKFINTFKGREQSFELSDNNQWKLYRTVPLPDESDAVQQILVVEENITERKIVEKQIESSLAEKESLFKEIHHRVKNNLSIIISLLSLEEMKFESNEEIKTAFEESRNRIRSMAVIHEKLYNSDNLSEINFKEYIELMANELHSIYATDNKIDIVLDLDKIALPIESAIPCGLILNELLTNAFKYAFKDRKSGEISVSLKKTGNYEYNLTVKDNGCGLPEYIDFYHPVSLGFEIIHRLAEQIDGAIDCSDSNGCCFSLKFN